MILVVGATSPVGRPVVDELLSRGQRVRGLSRPPREARLPAGVEPNETAAGYARMDRAVADAELEYTIVHVELVAANAIRWTADIAGLGQGGRRGPRAVRRRLVSPCRRES